MKTILLILKTLTIVVVAGELTYQVGVVLGPEHPILCLAMRLLTAVWMAYFLLTTKTNK